MLEQAKRPDSSPKSASVSGDSDSLLRRPMDREVDPFGLQLAVPENKRQTKKAGCSKCGGSATPCPTCGGNEDLETPPQVAKRSAGADHADPAERQADAIGAQIGAALPNHAVTGGSLSEAARSTAESHLGVDLGGTRIDGGSAGHAKAESEDAWAVTEGSDIAFADGQLQQSAHGRFLLGHELVHVAQQRAAKRALHQRKGGPPESPTPGEAGGMTLPEGASGVGRAEGETKSPAPIGHQLVVNGILLAPDKAFLEKQLLALVASSGNPSAPAEYVRKFEQEYIAGIGKPQDWIMTGGGVKGIPGPPPVKADRDVAKEIQPKLLDALASVQAKMDAFADVFAIRALAILNALLDESKKRVEREQQQYGLKRSAGAGSRGSGGSGGTPSGEGGSEGAAGLGADDAPGEASMDPSVRTAGLIGAARELLAKDKRIRSLEAEQHELRPRSDRLLGSDPPNPRLEQVGKQIAEEKRKLRILHQGYQARYPILGAFMESDLEHAKAKELGTLTAGGSSNSDVANVLLVEIESRLKDIEKVRKAAGDTLPVWQLPKVVAITASEKGVKRGSWEDAVVRTSVTDSEGGLADTALAVLGLVLGVAAIASTGGLALAVAGATVAIDLISLAKDIQTYDLKRASANTDFDRARSISDSDPTLFWVGLSIAGLALDIGDAIRAFRELRDPVRGVMAASEQQLQGAEERLRGVAHANKVDGVAEELIISARKAKNAEEPRAAFEIAGDAQNFENEAIDRAARESTLVSKELPSSSLTEAEMEAELEFLQRSKKLEGPVGERTAKVGEHEWAEMPLPEGMWCRFSKKPRCAIVEPGDDPKVVRSVTKAQVDAPELGEVADEVASAPSDYRKAFVEKLRGAADIKEGSKAWNALARELGMTPTFLRMAVFMAVKRAKSIRIHHIIAQTLAKHPLIALSIEAGLFTKHQWNNLIPLPYTKRLRNELIKLYDYPLPLHRSGHSPLIGEIDLIASTKWGHFLKAARGQDVQVFAKTTRGRQLLYELCNETREDARNLVLNWPTEAL